MINTEKMHYVNTDPILEGDVDRDAIGRHAAPETDIAIREDVYVERCEIQDPAVQSFMRDHAFELQQGNIDVDSINTLKDLNGWAYKLLLHEVDQTTVLVGVAFASRRGIDNGTIEISYALAEEYQKQGIATAAIGEVSEILARKYDVLARISPENKESIHLVNKLGFAAWEAAAWAHEDPYIKDKIRPNKLPKHEKIVE